MAFAIHTKNEHDSHDHKHAEPTSGGRKWIYGLWTGLVAGATMLAIILGVLVVTPTTLSASAAGNRQTGNSAAQNAKQVPSLVGADTTKYSIFDWAVLLSHGVSLSSLSGQNASVAGFIVASGSDPNLFQLTRYLITCCTLDAQPVSINVYIPNWANHYQAGQWLQIDGSFIDEPVKGGIVLQPSSTTAIDQPADPYVY